MFLRKTGIHFFAHCSRGLRTGLALGLGLLSLGAAAPVGAEPFRFPWDPPARPPTRAPLAEPRLTQPQVRSVLEREGARLVGAPQRRGGQTIAVGRDSDGGRRKFTLDADGRVIDVEILTARAPAPAREPRRPAERRPEFYDDLRALDRPLPGPRHSLDAPDDLAEPAPVEPAATSGRPGSASPVAAPQKQPDSADASLSPIKPLRIPGAPRIEPLPQ